MNDLEKYKVSWQVISTGSVCIDPYDFSDESDEEIKDWCFDAVHLEIKEQGNYDIHFSGLESAIAEMRKQLDERIAEFDDFEKEIE